MDSAYCAAMLPRNVFGISRVRQTPFGFAMTSLGDDGRGVLVLFLGSLATTHPSLASTSHCDVSLWELN